MDRDISVVFHVWSVECGDGPSTAEAVIVIISESIFVVGSVVKDVIGEWP
jgi:hypothetical protein